MAWATTKGFNFRATPGYVTDGTNEQDAGVDGGGNVYAYPQITTIGGESVTWGWTDNSVMEGRDRNSGIDRRLAGIVFISSGNGSRTFRVDVPASGDYKVRLALGDYTGYTNNLTAYIKDGVGGSTLATITDTSIAAQSFIDATGAEYTAANWPGSNSELTVTLSGTVFALELPDIAGTARVSHLQLEQVLGGGGGTKSSNHARLLLGIG